MTIHRSLLAAVVWTMLAGTAAAQSDGTTASGIPTERALGADEGAPAEGDDAAPAEDEVWQGPHVELGFTHYVLSDGLGAGSVNAGSFGGYLPLGWPRIGASIEAGVRSYAKGPDDFIGRGTLMVGYQHLGLDRFMPYACLVGTMGPLIGKRFHSSVSHLLYGAGIEVGADVNLVRSLFTGLAFSYIHASMWDLSYDLFIFKITVGL